MDSQHPTKLKLAISRMLGPLIRLCIRHEVTHAELSELMRLSYVENAHRHFGIPGTEMTNARVAVLTGLSRKEVSRLRELRDRQDKQSKPILNRAQRVVHGWLNDEEFLDENDKPLVLPIKNKVASKEVGSFVSLVKRYSGDVSYGAILEELNHTRVTEQPDELSVALVNHAYVPHEDDIEQVRVIGRSVNDLFNVALHNVESNRDDKRLQRQVVYSHVDEEHVTHLKELIETNAKELIDKLNSELAKAKNASDVDVNNKQKRVGFGVYYIEDDMKSSKKSSDD